MIDIEHTSFFEVPFSTAPDHRLIALGDQHGRSDLMGALIEHARTLPPFEGVTRLVLLGDLIDRGPDSLGCIDLAIQASRLLKADEQIDIAGNHEEFLFTALFDEDRDRADAAAGNWMRNGGIKVLEELGMPGDRAEIIAALGPDRVSWLKHLRTWHRSGDFLFVHAGVNPGLDRTHVLAPLGADFTTHFDENGSTRWIRDPFLDHRPGPNGFFGRFVVHGHTTPDCDPLGFGEMASRCRLNLDGGSFKTGRSRMAVIEGNQVAVVTAVGERRRR